MESSISIAKQHTPAYLLRILQNYTAKPFFMKYREYLTPSFCFRYLYNKNTEPINDRVYYNDICDYYLESNGSKYTLPEIVEAYTVYEFNIKNTPLTYKDINKMYCDGKCKNCDKQLYCF